MQCCGMLLTIAFFALYAEFTVLRIMLSGLNTSKTNVIFFQVSFTIIYVSTSELTTLGQRMRFVMNRTLTIWFDQLLFRAFPLKTLCTVDTSVFLTDTDERLLYFAADISAFAEVWLLLIENVKLGSFLILA